MKHVLLVAAALVALLGNGVAYAGEEALRCGDAPETASLLDELLLPRSGCCSWHGGMSGQCYMGRVVCNDGTLSPSCTCRASTVPVPSEGA